jgi:hypothetical protein
MKNSSLLGKPNEQFKMSDKYAYDLSIIVGYKYIILFAILCFFKPSAFLIGCFIGSLSATRSIKSFKKKYFKKKQLKENIPTTLLICPKCNRGYDKSWQVCLCCNAKLIENPALKTETNKSLVCD